MRFLHRALWVLILSHMSLPAGAQGVAIDWLHWPVDCTLGEDCYIARYVDHDPGPNITDYRCQGLAGPAHTGTDIGIPDLNIMETGVAVRAAASGQVINVRDGMEDVAITAETREAILDVACGNSLAIRHVNGFFTRYCHLKKNSLTHQAGDTVNMGDVVGAIGLSGDTNFPHVHFTVQRVSSSAFYDPFTATPLGSACTADNPPAQDMWRVDLPYIESGMIKAVMYGGTERPGREVINRLSHQTSVPATDKQLHVLVAFYGSSQGLTVTRSLTLPDGRVLQTEPRTYAPTTPTASLTHRLTLAYSKRDGTDLTPGLYRATYRAIGLTGRQVWQTTLTTRVE